MDPDRQIRALEKKIDDFERRVEKKLDLLASKIVRRTERIETLEAQVEHVLEEKEPKFNTRHKDLKITESVFLIKDKEIDYRVARLNAASDPINFFRFVAKEFFGKNEIKKSKAQTLPAFFYEMCNAVICAYNTFNKRSESIQRCISKSKEENTIHLWRSKFLRMATNLRNRDLAGEQRAGKKQSDDESAASEQSDKEEDTSVHSLKSASKKKGKDASASNDASDQSETSDPKDDVEEGNHQSDEEESVTEEQIQRARAELQKLLEKSRPGHQKSKKNMIVEKESTGQAEKHLETPEENDQENRLANLEKQKRVEEESDDETEEVFALTTTKRGPGRPKGSKKLSKTNSTRRVAK